jgi:hypothetical protein
MGRRKFSQQGFGVIQIFLIAILITAVAVSYRVYKNAEKRAELVRQEQLRKQELEKREVLIKKLTEQKNKVHLVLRKWEDAIKLAGMTSRISLPQPLSQMQAIRREMEDLKSNDCLNKATKTMADGMNEAIFAFEMFIKFPSNSSASETTSKYLTNSNANISIGMDELEKCIPAT